VWYRLGKRPMVFCTLKAMNRVPGFALGLICITVTAASTTSEPKKTATSTKTTKAGGTSTSPGSAAGHSHGKRGRASHTAVQRGPSFQTAPTPERYQEIQKALASHGFYKGEVNGTWGPDSVDALKEFQTSQNLPNDGKISSLSLIGLGLGPAHSYPGGVVPQSNQIQAAPTTGAPSGLPTNQPAGVVSSPPKPASPQTQTNQPAAAPAPPAKPPQS
jgi:Putative peptidoglycan binding domain